jgi:hypothetical protein
MTLLTVTASCASRADRDEPPSTRASSAPLLAHQPVTDVFDRQAVWANLCAPGQMCLAGDVDGDGRADLVIFNHQWTQPAGPFAQVAFSTGQSFAPPVQVSGYFCVPGETCAVADVDGDGKADLVAINPGGTTWIGWSNGRSNVSNPQPFGTPMCTGNQCALADVDGNGTNDLVAFHPSGVVNVQTFYPASTPAPLGRTFSGVKTWSSYFCVWGQMCSLADMDGDGAADAVAIDQAAPGNVWVGPSDKSSGFNGGSGGVLWNPATNWPGCAPGQSCLAGDVNGDGEGDVVTFENPGRVYVNFATGDPFKYWPGTHIEQKWLFSDAFGYAPGTNLIADVNGDGVSDVIALTQTASDQRVSVALSANHSRLLYHGGAVMTGDTKVYVQFLGTFSLGAQTLVKSLINGLGGSQLWGELGAYTDAQGNRVKNTLSVAGTQMDTSLDGTVVDGGALATKIVPACVTKMAQGAAPDPTAIYLFLVGSAVTYTGPAEGDLGYHASYIDPTTGVHVKWATVFDAGKPQNPDNVADNEASAIFHELAETVTNPESGDPTGPGGWYAGDYGIGPAGLSGYGGETGDLCNVLSPVTLNGHAWQLQPIFRNAGVFGTGCAGNPLTPAPLAYWSLDDSSTVTAPVSGLAYDTMAFPGNAAILTNVGIGQTRDAVLGQAYYFDGVKSRMVLSPNSSLQFSTGAFTVSLSVKLVPGSSPMDLGTEMRLIGDSNGTSGWELGVDTSNHVVFRTHGNPGRDVFARSSLSLSPGWWSHLVAIYAAPGASNVPGAFLFTAGVRNFSPPWDGADWMNGPYVESPSPIAMGTSPTAPYMLAHAYLDEIGLWNQALSLDAVKALYATQLEGPAL